MDTRAISSQASRPEEGSTTIPQGSTTSDKGGKQPAYLMCNVVYCIRNSKDGKVYVGSSMWYATRKGGHRYDLRRRKHKNYRLQEAYDRDGCDAFTFDVLDLTAEPLLREREQYWIDKLHATDPAFGYNICPRAESRKGVKARPETRARIGRASLGRKHTKEQVERQKCMATKRWGKAVIATWKDGRSQRFPSLSEASRHTGINVSAISVACTRGYRTENRRYKGVRFKYDDIVCSDGKPSANTNERI